MNKQFKKYFKLLGISVFQPSLKFLNDIVKAHLIKIPFENISKLLYKKQGADDIPDLSTYLDGIEKYNFGGTCYANNYYINLLLNHLGFDVMLCGADMKNPDVHIINIVTIDKQQYIVDTGYAAPFFKPLPLFLTKDYIVSLGNEKYIIKPKDEIGNSKIEHYYNGELRHWYTAKPKGRSIKEFRNVIKGSYSDEALFMNIFRITRFIENGSLVMRNLRLTESNGSNYTTIDFTRKELPQIVEDKFFIPADISREALNTINEFQDVFD